MALDFNGSTHFLQAQGITSMSTTRPLTISARCNPDTAGTSAKIPFVFTNIAGTHYLYGGINASGNWLAVTSDVTNFNSVSPGTPAASTGTWVRFSVALNSSGHLKVALDNDIVVDTTPAANPSMLIVQVGRFGGSWFDGKIADFAMWDAYLSDGELAALAAGYDAGRVRKANLRVHGRFVKNVDPQPEHINAGDFGGGSYSQGPFSPHPPMSRPPPLVMPMAPVTKSQSVAATQVGSVTVATEAQHARSIAATQIGSVTVATEAQHVRSIAATVIGVPSMIKTVGKNVSASVTATPSFQKKVSITIAATQVGSVTLLPALVFEVTVSATQIGSVSMSETFIPFVAATGVERLIYDIVRNIVQDVVSELDLYNE